MEVNKEDLTYKHIAEFLRKNLNIRNRSWLKQIHRDCFVGIDAVDLLINQGLVESRLASVKLLQALIDHKLIRHVTDSNKNFMDAHMFYRFYEDEDLSSMLNISHAGHYLEQLTSSQPDNTSNSTIGGTYSIQFAPHTVHNSYIIDLGLAEQIERALLSNNMNMKEQVFYILRKRVRDQISNSANITEWKLNQSTMVNNVAVHVYEREKPRGNFKNIKLVGTVNKAPVYFIQQFLDMTERHRWDNTYDHGEVIENIYLESNIRHNYIVNTKNIDTSFKSDETVIHSGDQGHDNVINNNIKHELGDNKDTHSYMSSLDHKSSVLKESEERLTQDDEAGEGEGEDMTMNDLYEDNNDNDHVNDNQNEINQSPTTSSNRAYSNQYRKIEADHINADLTSKSENCPSKYSTSPPSLTRIIYRTSKPIHAQSRPREACVLQDTFMDDTDGSYYTYEISVRHKDVMGTPNHVTDDVMLLLHHIKPIVKQGHNTNASTENTYRHTENLLPIEDNRDRSECPPSPTTTITGGNIDNTTYASSEVTVISQVDHRSTRLSYWWTPLVNLIREPYQSHSRLIRTKNALEFMKEIASDDSIQTILSPPVSSSSSSTTSPPPPLTNNSHVSLTSSSMSAVSSTSTQVPSQRADMNSSTTDALMYKYESQMETFHTTYTTTTSGDLSKQNNVLSATVSTMKTVDEPMNIAPPMSNVHYQSSTTTTTTMTAAAPATAATSLSTPSISTTVAVVSIKDFQFLSVIGRGGFGKVMQVIHQPTQRIYAMKIIKKSDLKHRKQIERTKTERMILAEVNHPFIVKLHYAFQSTMKLYMVIDFVQGGDFFTLMQKFQRLPESWVQFYSAEMGLALQHLHDMDIVYRDLKPENILLSASGHIKLTDFGLSRYFEMRPPEPEDVIHEDYVLTRSFCGTEQYMSPEMLLQKGHSYRVDWWCLGLLIHEMITGRHPFQATTHYDLLKQIVYSPPILDTATQLSIASYEIISALLIKDPILRLGGHIGHMELQQMAFYAHINWHDLYDMKMQPPYVPNIRDMYDTSSFETEFTTQPPVDSVVQDTSTLLSKSPQTTLSTSPFTQLSYLTEFTNKTSTRIMGLLFGQSPNMSEKSKISPLNKTPNNDIPAHNSDSYLKDSAVGSHITNSCSTYESEYENFTYTKSPSSVFE